VVALVVLAACGQRGPKDPADAGVTPLRTLPLAQVFVLEVGGTPPPDTVLSFPAGLSRTIVLRHGLPDQASFAILEFPETAFPGGETPEVTVRMRPGVYGIDLASSRPFTGGTITFKYARHFAAPGAARERYGTEAAFERALAIGKLIDEATIVLLPTRHSLADNLSASLDGPGSYVVAGPR
jgi:hypothetical protein